MKIFQWCVVPIHYLCDTTIILLCVCLYSRTFSMRQNWTATSLSVRVDSTDGPARLLALPSLYESIEGAKLRKKADKLIITLTKSAELTWSALKKND